MTLPQALRLEATVGGKVVRLPPRAHAMLVVLMMRRGCMIPRIDLAECVWPDPDDMPDTWHQQLGKFADEIRRHGIHLENRYGHGYMLPKGVAIGRINRDKRHKEKTP